MLPEKVPTKVSELARSRLGATLGALPSGRVRSGISHGVPEEAKTTWKHTNSGQKTHRDQAAGEGLAQGRDTHCSPGSNGG